MGHPQAFFKSSICNCSCYCLVMWRRKGEDGLGQFEPSLFACTKNPWFKEGMRMPLTLDIWLCLIELVTFSYRNIDTAWTLVSLWWNTVTLGVITTCPAYSRQNQTSYLFSLWFYLCFLESLFDLWIRSLAQKIMVPQRCHLAESKLIKRPSLLFFLFMGHIPSTL